MDSKKVLVSTLWYLFFTTLLFASFLEYRVYHCYTHAFSASYGLFFPLRLVYGVGLAALRVWRIRGIISIVLCDMGYPLTNTYEELFID